MWVQLAGWAGIATLFPLLVVWILPASVARPAELPAGQAPRKPPVRTAGLVACYTLFGFGYILPATYLPALARQLVDDPQVFGLAWPLFGLAAAASTIAVSWGLQAANRLRVWAASHLLMVVGVLLPCVWASLPSVTIAALLVGGTFMVITMLAMQEARARAEGNATLVLGRMTAGFALGQLLGPLASAAMGRFTDDFTTALNHALVLAAAGLLSSAFYLWREARQPPERYS
jgi:predicted MFS family arabinose efflux permease